MNRKITSFLIIILITISTFSWAVQNSTSLKLSPYADSVFTHIAWYVENEQLDSLRYIMDEHGEIIKSVSHPYWQALNNYIKHDYQQVINQLKLSVDHPARLYLGLLKARTYSILDNEDASDKMLNQIKSSVYNQSNQLAQLIYLGIRTNPGNNVNKEIDTSIIKDLQQLHFTRRIHELYKSFCIGMYYQNLVIPDSARKYYHKVRDELSEYHGYFYLNHQLNQKLGDNYYIDFDPSNANYHFQESLALLHQHFPYLTYDLFYNYQTMAYFLNTDNAYEYQSKALNLVVDNPEYKIQALLNMTFIYYQYDDRKAAEETLMKVEDLANKVYGDANPKYIDIYINIFNHYYGKNGNIFKALSYLELLIETYEMFPEQIDSYYYYFKGLLHYESGSYWKALEVFRNGLAHILDEKQQTSPDELPNKLIPKRELFHYQTRFIEYLAYTFYLYYDHETNALKDLKKSYEYYNLLAEFQMEIREKKPEFEIQLMTDRAIERRTILNNVEVSLDIYEKTNNHEYLEDCFEYLEKSRDVVLANSIYARELKKSKNIPDSLLQKERELIMKLELIRSNLAVKQSELKPEINNDQFERLVREHETIKKKINEYFTDTEVKKEMLTISQVQKKLNKKQVLLEYAIKSSEFFGVAITTDTVIYHRQKKPTELINKITKYNQILKEPPNLSSSSNYQEFLDISHGLYTKLIKPFEMVLHDKNEIILIPEDILYTIAFETLITHKNVSNIVDYSSLPYLVSAYNISYGLSATLYFDQQSKLFPKPIYAVAPKYPFQSNSENISRSLKQKLATLPALKGAQKEVEFLEKEFNAQTSLLSSLNESDFKKKIKSANILHLAMHSIIDPNYPEYSALILSSNTTDKSDGLLHTYEIMHYDLNEQLVVLSACNTGTGKLFRGEGIFSIAKGFIMSGSSGVITTLWEQNDAAGFDLMKNLYANMFNTNSPATALRKAKLDYLQQADPLKNHPYYWSGYILIGNPQLIHYNQHYKILAIVIVGILIFGFIYFNKRNY